MRLPALAICACICLPAAARRALSVAEQRFEARGIEVHRRLQSSPSPYEDDDDIVWHDAPGAWHQQIARIVDHRFSTFDALHRFAVDAKKAGVTALMLVSIQRTNDCPGPWYNGLQLCGHINGSYPVEDGSLEQWQSMLREIRPMRLMWWTNPSYWSVQGPVWEQAKADKDSDVGRWFSWGAESCHGIPTCPGRNVAVPGVGCAQGSWGSESGMTGELSAMASFGSQSYASYMVDAYSNTWTAKLGIDGYCEDVSARYGCMLQCEGGNSLPDWSAIVDKVRQAQPQLVMSGEGYGSWAEIVEANANIGGQGYQGYHDAMQRAAREGDASGLEKVASTSGADAATIVCFLHPAYDGKQPGGCPTMYFRDVSATIKDVATHTMWVALEAGSGIVSQHDYDPNSSCAGWEGCSYWSHGRPGAWWNVTNDPHVEGVVSPLWAFGRYRALNRLALRTKLPILASSAEGEGTGEGKGKTDGGALVYLKHDALGPDGDACIIVYNPGEAQQITIDLSSLPASLLEGSTTTFDLFTAASSGSGAASPPVSASPPPLSASWPVSMAKGEVKAFGGFSLSAFAPRLGKKGSCTADDGYRSAAKATTMQGCLLECSSDAKCENLLVEYAHITYMEAPPPLSCALLGPIADPGTSCTAGTSTLVKNMRTRGRPRLAGAPAPPPGEAWEGVGWGQQAGGAGRKAPPTSSPQPEAQPEVQPEVQPADASPTWPGGSKAEIGIYREALLREGATYDVEAVAKIEDLPTLTSDNVEQHPEWHAYINHVYADASASMLPLDLNTLTWLYWFAPIRLPAILLSDWVDTYEEAPYGTPWTGGLAAWTWGPEHLVRRLGFFVHRPKWPQGRYEEATRLEVMRVGPLPAPPGQRDAFQERGDNWFYHAIGSGIFARVDTLDHHGASPIQVIYVQHMSVPRVEIIGHVSGPSASTPFTAGEESAADWWPTSVLYELHDGSPCVSTARATHILTCANLDVPVWPPSDPPPTTCVGDGAVFTAGVAYELDTRKGLTKCTHPSPPPAPPPSPPAPPPQQQQRVSSTSASPTSPSPHAAIGAPMAMILLGLAVVLAIAISICLRLRGGGRQGGQRSWTGGFGARMGKGGEGSRDSDMEGEADTANLVPARESASA